MAPFTLEELQRQYDNFKRVSDHCAHADSTCHRCRRSSDTHQQFWWITFNIHVVRHVGVASDRRCKTQPGLSPRRQTGPRHRAALERLANADLWSVLGR